MITERSDRTGAPRRAHGEGRRRRRALALTSLAAMVAALVVGADMGVASAGTPTVQVATNAQFGTILTNDSGMALYTLDTDHNGQSTCHGACAAAWPPLTVSAATVPTGGPGVTGTVASSKQSDGTYQVTYNGAPLYTFVSDTSPGQVTGNGVAGFSVVTVSAVPSTTTTTTAPPTGGSAPGGPASPAASPTSPAPTAATAPSAGPAKSATSANPGTLAFTGAGPGLRWLLLLGLVLVVVGAGALRRAGASKRRTT
ncbi:MAG TPA: hypothetical protein VN816_05470 [Acidimicrobiales bacterium]|nr:hypothetical protein [Acidimicrobiales bacterium]